MLKRPIFMKPRFWTSESWRASTSSAAGPAARAARGVGKRLQLRPALQTLGDIGEVALLGRGVDDEMQRARPDGRRVTMKSSMMPPSSFSSSA